MAREGKREKPPSAGPIPFGIGQTKPHHYAEIAKTVWNNKHAPLLRADPALASFIDVNRREDLEHAVQAARGRS